MQVRPFRARHGASSPHPGVENHGASQAVIFDPAQRDAGHVLRLEVTAKFTPQIAFGYRDSAGRPMYVTRTDHSIT
jgi:hypothetical protein